MTYVLVLALLTRMGSSGVSIATAEFNTLQACERAGMSAKEQLEGGALSNTVVRFACVPKG